MEKFLYDMLINILGNLGLRGIDWTYKKYKQSKIWVSLLIGLLILIMLAIASAGLSVYLFLFGKSIAWVCILLSLVFFFLAIFYAAVIFHGFSILLEALKELVYDIDTK